MDWRLVFNSGNAGYNEYGCPVVYPRPLPNMHVAEPGYCTPGGGSHTPEPSSHQPEADHTVVEIMSDSPNGRRQESPNTCTERPATSVDSQQKQVCRQSLNPFSSQFTVVHA